MDETLKFNQERWEELSASNVVFSRPWFDLDPTVARTRVDPENVLKEIAGKDVLCLASGGGQQSVAFALLGANVTVVDFSQTQLQRDQEAAVHYGVQVSTLQGDMCNLSEFSENSFDTRLGRLSAEISERWLSRP